MPLNETEVREMKNKITLRLIWAMLNDCPIHDVEVKNALFDVIDQYAEKQVELEEALIRA